MIMTIHSAYLSIFSLLYLIVVSKPGDEPDITTCAINEDMNLVDSTVFHSMTNSQRKQYFCDRNNQLKYSFNTDYIYTFNFFAPIINLNLFQLDLSIMHIDLFGYLGAQPIEVR